MNNAIQWREALATTLPSFSRSATVEREARAWLTANACARDKLSTRQLVEGLWPIGDSALEDRQPNGPRGRLITHLLSLAELNLSDCASRGEPQQRQRFGRTGWVRPWVWHAPEGVKHALTVTCPACQNRFDVI